MGLWVVPCRSSLIWNLCEISASFWTPQSVRSFVLMLQLNPACLQKFNPYRLSTSPSNGTLLDSPIGDFSSINSVLESKIQCLTTIGSRREAIQAHDALVLLRQWHAFTIPKILYVLRTAPSLFHIQAVECIWFNTTLPPGVYLQLEAW